jgi:DNA-binding LacI/PurR family transcriptional regulator/DNA-binding transcriptional regulator YhcF (GntR family)
MSKSPAASPADSPRKPRTRAFKYRRVREAIRKQIAEGIFPPGTRMPNGKTLAKRFGTGMKTLERALGDLMREGLIIRKRGSGTYVTDRQSPAVFPGRSLKLAILWKETATATTMLNSFYGSITRGVLEALGIGNVQPQWNTFEVRQPTRAIWQAPDRSITVEVLAESHFSSVRHPPMKSIKGQGFDGLITAGIIVDEFLEKLAGLGLPTVFVDQTGEHLASLADLVYVDPFNAYQEAISFLADQGCRQIHFIGGFTAIPAPSAEMSRQEVAAFRQGRMQIDPDSYLRMSAYRQAMHRCQLAVNENWVHFKNPYFHNDQALAAELLALPREERPQAVICHGISQAETFLEIFSIHNQKLLAVGTTDRKYAGAALAIRAHGEEMGATAAELIISQLHRPGRLHHRVGVPMVFETQATGPKTINADLQEKS